MTPKQRVMNILRGRGADRVPFTTYEFNLRMGGAELTLRNRGVLPEKRTRSYTIHTPNVNVKTYGYDDNGRHMVKTAFETPYGILTTLTEPKGWTTWNHEYMFKSPDDYKALAFMIKDGVVTPDYGPVLRLIKDSGDGALVRDNMPLEPLQTIMRGYMGTEAFCYEWMDNRDEVLKLYELVVELNRKTYPVVADGPLEYANYGGNVVPQIIGSECFVKYYTPNYNEAAEVLHKKGKLIGSHHDSEMGPIMKELGETDLDYIEAYDPLCSPPVAEAKKHFGGKTLWINWPSGWQPESRAFKIERTLEMLRQAEPGGFIIGITENIPDDIWEEHFTAIMDAIDIYYNNFR